MGVPVAETIHITEQAGNSSGGLSESEGAVTPVDQSTSDYIDPKEERAFVSVSFPTF